MGTVCVGRSMHIKSSKISYFIFRKLPGPKPGPPLCSIAFQLYWQTQFSQLCQQWYRGAPSFWTGQGRSHTLTVTTVEARSFARSRQAAISCRYYAERRPDDDATITLPFGAARRRLRDRGWNRALYGRTFNLPLRLSILLWLKGLAEGFGKWWLLFLPNRSPSCLYVGVFVCLQNRRTARCQIWVDWYTDISTNKREGDLLLAQLKDKI